MGYSVREQVMIIIMFILLGFHGRRGEGCLRQEREALLRLKEAFNYPNGNSFPSWNNLTSSFSDCCSWESVYCDNSTHRVIAIDLDDARAQELRDTKWSLNASSFLPFNHLQFLYLRGNYLSGAGLFGGIKLPNLEWLDLGYNNLTEYPSFGDKSLRLLYSFKYGICLVYINDPLYLLMYIYTISHFTDLSHSRNLDFLWLHYNLLEDSIPESIMSLTSLTWLILGNNNLTGSLPQQGGLCRLKNLIALDLKYNKLEGQLPACLNNLTSLRYFSIEENHFEGTFPSSLFHSLRSLTLLHLSDNNFSGSFSLSLLANHSNLIAIYISCSNTNLKIETENPPFIPSFQLRILSILNCTFNQDHNNTMPTFLLHQYQLRDLELLRLNISGAFPSWLLTNNIELNTFNLTHNSFIAPFELNSTSKLLQMQFFDVSSNPISNEIPPHIASVFPNLISLAMSSCSLKGSFPASIGEMRQLNDLDLSNNNLSGYLPEEFGKGNNELRILKLSNNNLSGPCLPIRSNFTNLLILDLSNNNFKGKFQGGEFINSTKLVMLDISANQLFDEIPSWIGNFQHLSYLILSKNSFIGPLPESFCDLTNLTYLDLSHNKFNGSLPSCLNMPLLKHLHLQRNHFMGPLPSTLVNSPLLLTLDLMNNKFSGPIPRWMSSLFSLRVLMLKENKLEGSIPIYLCELKNISILDISQNKLSGGIPYCLSNITFGKTDAPRETEIGSFLLSWSARISSQYKVYIDTSDIIVLQEKGDVTLYRDQEVDFTSKRREESYKGSILNFMSGLDLSNNQLTGEIPSQIGSLRTIHALNFLNNHLKGPIPEIFSNLKQIESLDLSYNKLSGHILAQLTQLYTLSVFSVAHNNLSGMIPDMKYQFTTFDSSSYEGNHFLCRPFLQRSCSVIRGRDKQTHHREADDFRDAFVWSFGGAFGVFFLGVIIVLYLNPYVWNYRLVILERAIYNKFFV